MIESLIATPGGRRSEKADSARPQLLELQKQLIALNHAANCCLANHNYYEVEKVGDEVVMFDCDFIWSALRLQHTVQAVSSADQEQSIRKVQSQINAWIGPHTVRYSVEAARHYIIPPGAQVELLRLKDAFAKQHGLTRRAGSILGSLESELEWTNVVRKVTDPQHPARLSERLAKEIAELASLYDDVGLVGEILEGSESIDSWLGEPPAESTDSYQTSFKALQTDPNRRERAMNNLADAVNVALLVWLFHSPKQKSKRKPIPILVTGTHAVQELQRVLPLPEPEHIHFLQRPFIYQLSSALRAINGNQVRAVISDARVLVSDTHDLLSEVGNVLRQDEARGRSRGPLLVRLGRTLSNFVERWQETLDPLHRYRDLDRAARSNALLTGDLRALLNELPRSEDRGQTRGVLERIQGILMETPSFQQLLEPFRPPELSPVFQLSALEPERQTSLLKNQRPGIRPEDVPRSRQGGTAGLRYAVFVRHLPSVGALLVADYSDAAEGADRLPRLAVTWTHELDIRLMVNATLQALRLHPEWREDAVFEVSVFGMSEPEYHCFAGDSALRDPQALMECCSNADYVEFSLADVTLYWDIEPLGGVECQVGVVAPVQRWRDGLTSVTAELSSLTRLPLSKEHLRALMDQIIQKAEV